jgi:hypothetical protein
VRTASIDEIKVRTRVAEVLNRWPTAGLAVRKGLRLHPDGDDPYAFRIDLSGFGLGTSPVVFSRDPDGEVTALYAGLAPMSFQKRPDVRNPRPWVNGLLAVGAMAIAVRRRRLERVPR